MIIKQQNRLLILLIILNCYCLCNFLLNSNCLPSNCQNGNYSICRGFTKRINDTVKICGLDKYSKNRLSIEFSLSFVSNVTQNFSIYFHSEFFNCLINSKLKLQTKTDIYRLMDNVTSLNENCLNKISSSFIMVAHLDTSCLSSRNLSYSFNIPAGEFGFFVFLFLFFIFLLNF